MAFGSWVSTCLGPGCMPGDLRGLASRRVHSPRELDIRPDDSSKTSPYSAFSGTFSNNSSSTLIGLDAFGLGLEVEDHAVPQRGQKHAPHVLEADVVAAVQQRPDFGRQGQRLGRAGTGAPADVLIGDRQGERALGMRGQHQPDQVILHVRRPGSLRAPGPAIEDLGSVHHLAGSIFSPRVVRSTIVRQFLPVGVAHEQLEQEAVQLGLGQRIGAFLLDRVLRGHDQERLLSW